MDFLPGPSRPCSSARASLPRLRQQRPVGPRGMPMAGPGLRRRVGLELTHPGHVAGPAGLVDLARPLPVRGDGLGRRRVRQDLLGVAQRGRSGRRRCRCRSRGRCGCRCGRCRGWYRRRCGRRGRLGRDHRRVGGDRRRRRGAQAGARRLERSPALEQAAFIIPDVAPASGPTAASKKRVHSSAIASEMPSRTSRSSSPGPRCRSASARHTGTGSHDLDRELDRQLDHGRLRAQAAQQLLLLVLPLPVPAAFFHHEAGPAQAEAEGGQLGDVVQGRVAPAGGGVAERVVARRRGRLGRARGPPP